MLLHFLSRNLFFRMISPEILIQTAIKEDFDTKFVDFSIQTHLLLNHRVIFQNYPMLRNVF